MAGCAIFTLEHPATRFAGRLRLAAASVLMVASALVATDAGAQRLGPLLDTDIPFDIDRGNNVSVADRPHPEDDALGVPAGAFIVYPEVGVGAGYTSNVFGAQNHPRSDGFLELQPDVRAESQWSRNWLRVEASADLNRYLDETIKNETGYLLSAAGRIDFKDDSNLLLSASHDKIYLEQYSGAFPANAAGSVPLHRTQADVRGTYVFNRLRLVVDARINRMDFDDTRAVGGQSLDQDYRDETAKTAGARAEYAISPTTALFVQGSYIDSDYRLSSTAISSRSSREYRFLSGITFDAAALARASAGIGYSNRNYRNSVYPSIHSLAVDIRLEYFLSGLTTISLALKREPQDAIVGRSPGYIATMPHARVDHELLRNLILYTQADFEHDKFRNLDRVDNLFRIGAGAKYTPRRNIVVNPDISYFDRKSRGDLTGQTFKEVRFSVLTTLRI